MRRVKNVTVIAFLTCVTISCRAEVVVDGFASFSSVGFLFSDLYNNVKCRLYECCSEKWINKDVIQRLQMEVDERLHGQHLAQDTVLRAIQAHVMKLKSSKALVLSFHGFPGTGKNFLAKMVARALYKKEMRSQFFHLFDATLHFPHREEMAMYKNQIQSWVLGNLTLCERSVFVFDEVDKMSNQLLDSLAPFLDFHESVNGVDSRRAIFIFLSNGGANAIAQRTLEHHRLGLLRDGISLKEMEEIIQLSAFNEDGGMKTSRLVSKHLVDHFVPFLPLEWSHVVLCFRDYLKTRGIEPTGKQLDFLAKSLNYFPKDAPLYSASGCKKVEHTADFMLIEYLREQQHSPDEL